MKRIAWITTGFSIDENDTGGVAAIHNLARELSHNPEIELTIFSLYYPFNRPEYNFHKSRVYSFAGEKYHKKIDKPGIWRRCLKKFSEEHKKKKFDIIHSMWAGESGNISAKLHKKHNIPFILNICGGELAEIKEINYGSRLKYWQKKFVDNSIKEADKIITGSEYVVKKILNYYGHKIGSKILKIPFGADEGVFYPFQTNDSNKKFKIINIANAVPVKDHDCLFKAIKAVSKVIPQIKLAIYGKDNKGLLKNLLYEIGLQENVDLHNFIEHNNVANVLNESGIFILSSLYESQNMSIIEAALCGLPVVSTDVGCAREITEHIVQPKDYEELANKIIKVINNFDMEKQKSYAKIKEIKDSYSLKECVNKFINLYYNI